MRHPELAQCILLLVPTCSMYIPGDCVLEAVDTSAVPDDTLCKVGPIETYQATRFQQKQLVYGVTLLGSFTSQSTLAVDFCWIATSIVDMFASGPDIDAAKQAGVLRRMYRRKAGIPIFEAKDGSNDEEPEMELAPELHSICDQITANVKAPVNQTQEVIEHILHAYLNAGLALEFEADWGASKSSKAWEVLQSAVSKGFFTTSDLDSERGAMGEEGYVRTVIQEFHWFLTGTAWELWGADGIYIDNKEEWPQLHTLTQLKSRFPEGWALHERTTGKVMQRPRQSTLDGLKTLQYQFRNTASCTMPRSLEDSACMKEPSANEGITVTTSVTKEPSANEGTTVSTTTTKEAGVNNGNDRSVTTTMTNGDVSSKSSGLLALGSMVFALLLCVQFSDA
eukprot:TRINITY_DN65998_c0_g1_i1.p1 TRINITY_DN65998_c0_g1~~TRINITY_DN65998_c0_g1_i1.p1  ORF type:complete len:395 (-),score=61.18 TRINITY_DN65998_c0_g1_i1:86-1270(-)